MQTNNNNNQINEVSANQEQITLNKPRLVKSELAKKLLIKGESLKEFEKMRSKILQGMLIITEIENNLVEKIISIQWELRRLMDVKRHVLNEQNEIKEEEQYRSDKPRQRIRNIKKVRLNSLEIKHILHHQLELEKSYLKTLERLREEQRLNSAQSSIPKNHEK